MDTNTQLVLMLLFPVVWVGVGFITAFIRWYWIEGSELISTGYVAALYVPDNPAMLLFSKPRGITEENVKSSFFLNAVVYGPLFAGIFWASFITSCIWTSIMKMIK